jgi:nucleoside-diphosphate-sugar epimerase
MRVVVSGATGFLGGVLCRCLSDAGVDLVGLGRNRERGNRLREMGVGFVAADIGEPPDAALVDSIGGADAFVHAAALSSAWGETAAFMRANVFGTRHAMALARAAGVRRFIFISSPSVVFRFADQTLVREDAPLPKPINVYAASKQVAEAEVLVARDLAPIILRPRAIYGPGDKALLPRLIRAAGRGLLPLLRGGFARTNLTYVEDAARAVEAALHAPPTLSGRIYNIAGEEVPLRFVVEQAAARAGINVRWRPVPWPLALAAARLAETVARLTPGRPEPAITAYGLGLLAFTQTLDTSAATADLGFVPKVGFDEGLDLTFGPAP